MAAFSPIKAIQHALDERARKKRVELAAGWPQTTAAISIWHILQVGEGAATSFANNQQIEAAYSFSLNGEYYGGYVRSGLMSRKLAEKVAVGSPEISVRYNPSNPDQAVVLAEDNSGKLPFEIVSG
jgi:hypothetical protein